MYVYLSLSIYIYIYTFINYDTNQAGRHHAQRGHRRLHSGGKLGRGCGARDEDYYL